MHGTGYAGVRGTSRSGKPSLPQGLGWPLDFGQESGSYREAALRSYNHSSAARPARSPLAKHAVSR